jgi:hypothetical protein
MINSDDRFPAAGARSGLVGNQIRRHSEPMPVWGNAKHSRQFRINTKLLMIGKEAFSQNRHRLIESDAIDFHSITWHRARICYRPAHFRDGIPGCAASASASSRAVMEHGEPNGDLLIRPPHRGLDLDSRAHRAIRPTI